MKDDQVYLVHIQDAVSKIHQYTSEGRDAFLDNPMAQDAVVRNFEIIGEAVKRISDQAKAKHPEIPWREVAGFRDVLIHNYMGINIQRVWNAIEQHLPQLEAAVAALLDSQDNP